MDPQKSEVNYEPLIQVPNDLRIRTVQEEFQGGMAACQTTPTIQTLPLVYETLPLVYELRGPLMVCKLCAFLDVCSLLA